MNEWNIWEAFHANKLPWPIRSHFAAEQTDLISGPKTWKGVQRNISNLQEYLRTTQIPRECIKIAQHGCIRVVSWAFSGRAGFGLKFIKMWRADSGLHAQLFYSIQSNDFFFREVHLFLITVVTSVSCKVILIFCSAYSICKHSCVIFYLFGLVSHSFWEGDAMALLRKDQPLTKFVAFNKRWPTNRLFMTIALS